MKDDQRRRLVEQAMRRLEVKMAAERETLRELTKTSVMSRPNAQRPHMVGAPKFARLRVTGLRGWELMLQRMEAGIWYSQRDLVALMRDCPPNSVRAWLHQKLRPRGMVERAHDGRSAIYRKPHSATETGHTGDS